MFNKILFNTILIIGLAILQIAFISSLPHPLNYLNLIVLILVFMLVIGDLGLTLWFGVGIGLILDLYSFSPFGTHIVSLVAVIIAIYFLLNAYFTNRSLYSFLTLSALAIILYDILNYAVNSIYSIYFGNILMLDLSSRLIYESKIIALNLAATILFFYIANYITNRLKPVFLLRNK